MEMNTSSRGFALLVAVIFVSVMLTFALLMGNLSYKQTRLSNIAIQSQYALYAADAALECVLDKDRDGTKQLAYNLSAPTISCNGVSEESSSAVTSNGRTTFKYRFDLGTGPDARCADVTVYKYETPQTHGTGQFSSYFFSQGYSTACDNVAGQSAYAARGLRMRY